VAVGLPIHSTFHYRIPDEMQPHLRLGMRVVVPFGKRRLTGFVVDFAQEAPVSALKDIASVLDDAPWFNAGFLQLARWVAGYYFSPIGEVIKSALPPGSSLSSQQQFQLSPAGAQKLTEPDLPPPLKRLLSLLQEHGAMAKGRLMAEYADSSLAYLLLKARREGWIEADFLLGKKISGRVIRPMVRFNPSSMAEADLAAYRRRNKKKAVILDYLANFEEVPLDELRERTNATKAMLTPLQELGLVTIRDMEMLADATEDIIAAPFQAHDLSEAQTRVLKIIEEKIAAEVFFPALLHGITGSGKTEIYLRAIEYTLKMGREVIILVPEITLTPQFIRSYKAYFRDRIAVMHSGLSPRERAQQWQLMLEKKVSIVTGARSAIFAPFENIGLIVVDEEHDHAYKQEKSPPYHARDLAIIRGSFNRACVLLGSATPSLESYYNSWQKKFALLELPERVLDRPLPEVLIVDMKAERKEPDKASDIFSLPLLRALEENLATGKQSLIFLNRRGYANFLLCADCGFTPKCPNCDITLTFHKKPHRLTCHYCGLNEVIRDFCPECQGYNFKPCGYGTEKIVEELTSLFPEARIARMDRDTMTSKEALFSLIERVRQREVDILIGTQMITKGHDFHHVTLVGVVLADTMIHFPDFRAAEKTFQVLTQVAGRAGRGEFIGRVIIQTYHPDHYAIECASQHDYAQFYQTEMRNRAELSYPPLAKFALLRFESADLARFDASQQKLDEILSAVWQRLGPAEQKTLEYFGPSKAPLARLKGYYRGHILLRGQNYAALNRFIRAIMKRLGQESGPHKISLRIDIDPQEMM
jgi:primosomal protein N' (replication factor Y)